MMLLTDPTLPPARITHAPLRLVAGERWCCKCGYELTNADMDPDQKVSQKGAQRRPAAHCPRCHSKRLVPAVQVLLPEEYMLLI